MRTGHSSRSNRYSVNSLADSVLPTPVGPISSSELSGLPGGVSPDLIFSTTSHKAS